MLWKPHTEQPEVRVTALFAQQASDGGWVGIVRRHQGMAAGIPALGV